MKRQNKKRKISNKFKLLVIVILVLLAIYIYKNPKQVETNNISERTQNNNYLGIGQQKVKENEYTSIFTTKDKKVYKEYKQNGNSSWSDKYYWGGTMAENGCGITCMSILASGYGKNINPENLRKKYVTSKSEHLDGDKMSSEIIDYLGIDNTDFYYNNTYFEKEYIINWLKKDKPIIICVWDKPDYNWTKTSHYMLLIATDGINKIYVSNPNGEYGQIKMSGWYDTEEVLPYIAKAMFIKT